MTDHLFTREPWPHQREGAAGLRPYPLPLHLVGGMWTHECFGYRSNINSGAKNPHLARVFCCRNGFRLPSTLPAFHSRKGIPLKHFSASPPKAALINFHGRMVVAHCEAPVPKCTPLGVNLGDDADTTGAVGGQLAGACWGESRIPGEWLEGLARRDRIEQALVNLLKAQ